MAVLQTLRGFFDEEGKNHRLTEIETMAAASNIWNDSDQAKGVLKERSDIIAVLEMIKKLRTMHANASASLEIGHESGDKEFENEAIRSVKELTEALEKEEFRLKMKGPYDHENAILEFSAGSGGTEAQDWAEMLLRMYLRWAERKGFTAEELDYQAGEGAGIKRATILISGQYAYGNLRSENGVHRLVRISPFDSNARRHTSFAAISVTPEIEEDINIVIEEKDLRVDTYRSSGAGGQHVNKTDSAVRLTHAPSGIVVACQNERSQHKNKAMAMKILKSKLFELQRQEQENKLKSIQGDRKQVDFGNQIRSYVLQPYKLVKDLRTNYETSDPDSVLNGEIDPFIDAYLTAGIG